MLKSIERSLQNDNSLKKIFFLNFFRLKVPDVMPPWYETLKSMERSLQSAWTGNQKFRDTFIDNLIKDFLHAEIAGIVSSTITVNLIYHHGKFQENCVLFVKFDMILAEIWI